jgi:uncharacterized protein (DUF486 family)
VASAPITYGLARHFSTILPSAEWGARFIFEKNFNMYVFRTIALLLSSNIFMTIAWYGHLRIKDFPLWKVILISWGIALVEYCLMVPANRIGYLQAGMSGFQLKIVQEVITLVVFSIFAVVVLKEKMTLNYAISFCLVLGAVYFAFRK